MFVFLKLVFFHCHPNLILHNVLNNVFTEAFLVAVCPLSCNCVQTHSNTLIKCPHKNELWEGELKHVQLCAWEVEGQKKIWEIRVRVVNWKKNVRGLIFLRYEGIKYVLIIMFSLIPKLIKHDVAVKWHSWHELWPVMLERSSCLLFHPLLSLHVSFIQGLRDVWSGQGVRRWLEQK